MIIGLPKETLPGETRISVFPDEIKQLASDELQFQVESGAGLGAFISDESYIDSGAKIIPDVYADSDIIIKINPPSKTEIDKLQENSCLISLINPFINHRLC